MDLVKSYRRAAKAFQQSEDLLRVAIQRIEDAGETLYSADAEFLSDTENKASEAWEAMESVRRAYWRDRAEMAEKRLKDMLAMQFAEIMGCHDNAIAMYNKTRLLDLVRSSLVAPFPPAENPAGVPTGPEHSEVLARSENIHWR